MLSSEASHRVEAIRVPDLIWPLRISRRSAR
jgi:hypothetical protein